MIEIKIDNNTYINHIEIEKGEIYQVGDVAVIKADKMTVYFNTEKE